MNGRVEAQPFSFCRKFIVFASAMVANIYVRFLHVTEVSDDEFEFISEQVRLLGISPTISMEPSVYKRFVLGRWLACIALKTFGIEAHVLASMKLTDYGKPFIPDQQVSFNVSHSADLVVCVSAFDCKVGVDIEALHTVEWREYEDCFLPAEWSEIQASASPSVKLLQVWTKKESLLKADGRGLQIPMRAVEIKGDEGYIAKESKTWYLREVHLPGYSCHVCTELPMGGVVVERGLGVGLDAGY